ncbi:MAG TPA: DinB family protein [Candidatus Acidoferrales bacterium]|nr:DinB family protein [Candidatus Acidoferrales bacterium]
MEETTLPAAVLAQLRQTPEILAKMLEAATEDQMAWKPSADRWSIGEVLGHLRHVEQEIYLRRIRQFLEDEDEPRLEAYDQNACYEAGEYAGAGRDLLKGFTDRRWHSLALLYQLPPGSQERPARHSRFGRLRLDAMLHEWAYHDLGHIRQIAELYRTRAFYPAMGPYRDYYTPRP